jgi:hypothetical protein
MPRYMIRSVVPEYRNYITEVDAANEDEALDLVTGQDCAVEWDSMGCSGDIEMLDTEYTVELA